MIIAAKLCRYATERKTMGTHIINHQSVANLIADMAIGVETARLMVLKSAFDVDLGRRNTYFASIAKVACLLSLCLSKATKIVTNSTVANERATWSYRCRMSGFYLLSQIVSGNCCKRLFNGKLQLRPLVFNSRVSNSRRLLLRS